MALLLLSGCASTVPANTPVDSLLPIHVVRRDWHTGIVIAAKDWPNPNWTVLTDFPDADYLEFGWGDERFYQSEQDTFWLGIRAALWPTSSVIHVIGLPASFTTHAQADEVVQVRVPAGRLHEVAAAIEKEFTDDAPQATASRHETIAAPNRFYRAKRSFYFPRMCNWWIATRLQQAGCPVAPWTVITASRVMNEARECAHKSVNRASHPHSIRPTGY